MIPLRKSWTTKVILLMCCHSTHFQFFHPDIAASLSLRATLATGWQISSSWPKVSELGWLGAARGQLPPQLLCRWALFVKCWWPLFEIWNSLVIARNADYIEMTTGILLLLWSVDPQTHAQHSNCPVHHFSTKKKKKNLAPKGHHSKSKDHSSKRCRTKLWGNSHCLSFWFRYTCLQRWG